MRKFAVLGSCLSGLTAAHLKSRGFKFLGALNHIRLDAFLGFMKDPQSLGAPLNDIRDLKPRLLAGLNEKQAKMQSHRLELHAWEYLEGFKEILREAEFLIVDNNYDVYRSVYEVEVADSARRLFSNLIVGKESLGIEDKGLLDLRNVRDIYQDLVHGIMAWNPDIKIFFINYPTSGFERRGVQASRVSRGQFIAKQSVLVKGWFVFPLIQLQERDLSDKGGLYFDSSVYFSLAAAIEYILDGKEITFDDTVSVSIAELRKQIGVDDMEPSALENQFPEVRSNPYRALPDRQFWKVAVGDRYPLAIDQLYEKKYSISVEDGVATCGSCFAQHIGRRLHASGFNYLDVEPAPTSITAHERVSNGYGIYSARYGNVYTAAQLLQLIERALERLKFDEAWELAGQDGQIRYVDPFRPNLAPKGYATPEEMLEEQHRHLAAVRELFSKLDVFVFTMGLTELWRNKDTGAVYPIAPGVTAGRFDPDLHDFHNLTYEETLQDMLAFIDIMKEINPEFRMLLTVSPVPLTATAESRHVLISTMHSKSILRAVAGELERRFDFVDYFPSYEIVMSPPFRGMFFQNNMRTVHDQGVDFIMGHFFAQHQPDDLSQDKASELDNEEFCDEAFLALARNPN